MISIDTHLTKQLNEHLDAMQAGCDFADYLSDKYEHVMTLNGKEVYYDESQGDHGDYFYEPEDLNHIEYLEPEDLLLMIKELRNA